MRDTTIKLRAPEAWSRRWSVTKLSFPYMPKWYASDHRVPAGINNGSVWIRSWKSPRYDVYATTQYQQDGDYTYYIYNRNEWERWVNYKVKLYIDYIWGRSKTQYQADVQAELDRIGQTRASRARDEGVEFVENEDDSGSEINDPVENSSELIIKYFSLKELDMWFVTVTNASWTRDLKIEYKNWEVQDLVWWWDSYLGMVDTSKWDWRMLYLDINWIDKSMKLWSLDSMDSEISIASNSSESWKCTNARGAEFYKAYNSTCISWTQSEARSCKNWYDEYYWKACLTEAVNIEIKNQLAPLLNKLVAHWRNHWAEKQKRIIWELKNIVDIYKWTVLHNTILYIHDYLVSWWSVPDVTEDLRLKLIDSGKAMNYYFAHDSLSVLVYNVIPDWDDTMLPGAGKWDFKNLDANNNWYGWYSELILWWLEVWNDAPWNLNFWYAWAAWNLSLNLLRRWAEKEQYAVDWKMLDNDWNAVWKSTLENEKWDSLWIWRWYLLRKKYWTDLPYNYMDYVNWIDFDDLSKDLSIETLNSSYFDSNNNQWLLLSNNKEIEVYRFNIDTLK